MRRFIDKHPFMFIISIIVLGVAILFAGIFAYESHVRRPDPGLDGNPRAVTVLERVELDGKNDPTYYNIVKLHGIDVLYLQVYNLSNESLVPWLKPDGSPMTYQEYQDTGA